MRINCSKLVVRLALASIVLVTSLPAQQPHAQPPAGHALDMTVVKPETVGFSSERLERLHALMQKSVDEKQIAGIVTILARHGKIVDYRTYGKRDMASGAPMTKDVIFRDYSMTKPVTGVAMMILYEEGKWLPSDTIAKFIPEFAHLKVFKGVDADGKMILVDPEHAPTMRELMSLTGEFGIGGQVMRPGFGYGINCAVVFDPPEANLPEGKGTFFWDGAAGTWFWVDPTNDVVFIGMIQRMLGPLSPNLEYESRSVVYGALVDPGK